MGPHENDILCKERDEQSPPATDENEELILEYEKLDIKNAKVDIKAPNTAPVTENDGLALESPKPVRNN